MVMVMSIIQQSEFQEIVFGYGWLDTLARSVLGPGSVCLGMAAFVGVLIW